MFADFLSVGDTVWHPENRSGLPLIPVTDLPEAASRGERVRRRDQAELQQMEEHPRLAENLGRLLERAGEDERKRGFDRTLQAVTACG